MSPLQLTGTITLAIAEIAVLVRAILRPHREPASRFAWSIVIIVAPVVGILAYLLLGEVRISLVRREKGRAIDANLPRPAGSDSAARQVEGGYYAAPFALSRSINGLAPSDGN